MLLTDAKQISNIEGDFYRVNRDILQIHEFDEAPSPVSLSNFLFDDSLPSILPPLTTETRSLATSFNITEKPTAAGALLKNTTQNLKQPATASPTNKAIDNMSKTIECNSIRGHIASKIRKETEPIVRQKLKPLLKNYESLIQTAKETYTHQLKILKEELHRKNKIINRLLRIIEKLGNYKRETQFH